VKRVLRVIYGRMALQTSRGIIRKSSRIRQNLRISYATLYKFDGLGAQLQRVLAIRALSKYFGIPIFQSKIEQVAVHPLDNLENPSDYIKFIEDLNFLISEGSFPEDAEKLFVDNLKFSHLLKVFLSTLRGKHVLLLITHPYKLIDAKPEIYKMALDKQFLERCDRLGKDSDWSDISLHHRSGTGSMVVQSGQKISREVSLKETSMLIRELSIRNNLNKLTVYTDASQQPFIFKLLKRDLASWKDVSGTEGQQILVGSESFEELTALGMEVEIRRGGNPLQAILGMSRSNVLITSRSSFSYVAAILTKSQNVYVPKDFWHPPLPGWTTY
jgi:hypothetical protein